MTTTIYSVFSGIEKITRSNFDETVSKLKDELTNFSLESVKAATSQMALEKVQLKAIFAAKGLSGAELDAAVKAAILSNAEKEASASTLGFSTAVKGLGAQFKAFATAHPILLAITATIATIGVGYKIFDLLTVSVEEAKNALEDSKSAFESINNELESVNTELDTNKRRIEELNKLDKLTYTEKGELDNLKATSEELRIQLALLEKKRAYEKEDLIEKTVSAYNKEFNGVLISNETVAQKKNFINETYSPDVELQIPEANLDLSLLVAQYQKFNEVQLEALNIGDEFVHNKFSGFLDEIDKEIWEQIESLNQYKEILTSIPYDSLSTDAQDALAKISNNIEYLWKTFDPSGWNALQFDNLFDMEGIEKTKEELIELQKSGQLDLSSYPVLSKAIANLNLVLDDGVTNSQSFQNNLVALGRSAENSAGKFNASTRSLPDALNSFPIDKLEELIALYKSGAIDENTISSYDDLNTIMQETGITADEAIKALKEFSDDYTLSSQLISDLESTTTLIAKLKDEIEQTGTLGVDSLSTLAKQFPELEYAVSQFNQGLISTDDLITLLQTAYESDADAFRTAMIAKLSGNETFFSTIANNNQSLFEELGKAYGLDVSNWKSLAHAKAQIDQQLIQNLSSAWSKYYGTVVDAATGMTKLTGAAPRHGSSQGVAFSNQEQADAYAKALDAVTRANALKHKLDEAAKIEIDVPDFGGIKPDGYKGSGSGKDKKEKEPKTKDFDWIKRRQELLQKIHDQEEQVVDDEEKSYQTRIVLINDLIAKDNERLEFNKKAAESYTKVWEEAKAKIMSDAAKQNEDGDAIIASIMNGNTENQTFDGDLADSIQAGVDAYDDYTDGLENSEEIEKEIQDHLKKQLELKIAIVQAQTDILEAEMDALDAEIKLMEATGQAIDEGQLKKQLSLSEEIADSYSNQIDALNDQLDEVDEGSAEYYSIRSQIKQCEAAIADCAVQQAEWNDQTKRLPIEKISRTLEILGFIKEDLQNFIDQQNALGKITTLPQFQEFANINLKQIEELMNQQKLLSDLIDDYEFNSTKYQDTVSELQDIDNEISGLIQSQYDLNKAILQLPIDQLNKAGDVLNNAVTAMSDILADYDSALGAVTGTLDKQIETINDLKDATTEQYESKIKPLQDELDTLQKQNEARKIQLDLEQAQYDLDKAKEQKTNKVNKIACFYSDVKYASSYFG